jgi:hypothetical protein
MLLHAETYIRIGDDISSKWTHRKYAQVHVFFYYGCTGIFYYGCTGINIYIYIGVDT